MVRMVVPYPVLPGKSEDDIRRIADRFKSDPQAYRESRAAAGITMERAFWQHTPMGDFLVAYLESTRNSIAEALGTAAEDQSELGRWFIETVKEVHGVDITQPPAGPPPENVAEWTDPQATGRGRGFAFCAPLIPEMEDYARTWSKEVFGSEAMTESRRALGQTIELVTLVQTPQGPVTAIYLEGDDPVDANRRLTESTSEFDMSFKENLRKIYPPFVDFSQPVPGVTEVFDSEGLLARA